MSENYDLDTKHFVRKRDLINWVKSNNQSIDVILRENQEVSTQQAFKDFRRERVILNDVAFIPHAIDSYRCEMFVSTLLKYSSRLISICPDSCTDNYRNNPTLIAETILKNSCRTSAGADSYFVLQNFCNIDGTIISQKTSGSIDDPPVLIRLNVDTNQNGSIMLVSSTEIWNSFAVYDSSAVEENGNSDPLPWLEIETKLVDVYNYKTEEHVRSLHIVCSLPSEPKHIGTADSKMQI